MADVSQGNLTGANIITTGVKNSENSKIYTFEKAFAFNVQSELLKYKLKQTREYETAEILTWVHTLPWQYIYFYLTPKEFHDIQTENHTAKVIKVHVEIINLGNRTPFITGTKSVSYANANSQTTIGVWERLEELGPFQCGNNLMHKQLYGLSHRYNDNLRKATAMQNIHYHDHGAAQQPIMLDNRGSYHIQVSEKEQGAVIPLNDNTFFLPPLVGHAKMLYNATNSIGTIYEKEYSPMDGTIHKFNNGYNHEGNVPRRQNPLEQIDVSTGKITQTPLTRIGVMSQSKYTTTTIDNLYFSPLQGTASDRVLHSLGIGVLPLINPDNKLEKSVLSLIVKTRITIEGKSHGTNVLMDFNRYPQPNTYEIALRTQQNEFTNMYGMAGLPIVNKYTEGMEADEDGNQGITSDSAFSTVWGNGITHTMKAIRIPGQRRVTGRMEYEEKVEVFQHNLRIREHFINAMQNEGTVINIIENGENAQYAIPKGCGFNIPPNHDEFWTKLGKVGNKEFKMTTEEKAMIPAQTSTQTHNFTGTTEGTVHAQGDLVHPLTLH